MVGLAAYDDSDGDITVVKVALGRERDGAGNFQRSGYGEYLHLMPRAFERGACPGNQLVIEMIVETGFDDEKTGHGTYSGMGM